LPCPGGIHIAPSLLGANFAYLGDAVKAVEGTGIDRFHIDVMDGDFVPNFTFGTDTVRALRPLTNLPLEVHMMVHGPERHIETFANAGADAMTIHFEACTQIAETLERIQALGCHAGLAINPDTAASAFDDYLDKIQLALVMTIYPGFAGQKLIPDTLDKIRAVRQAINSKQLSTELEVDGGVTADNLTACIEAGADVIVAATAIFAHTGGAKAGATDLVERAALSRRI
jgi:ribulose-phosphate 3-epimerase